jgi:hypothetical protein
MKNLTRHLWLAVALLVVVHPAWAELGFEMEVDCLADATAGSTITTSLHLENQACSPINVRLMSSIAGNANQTVGGIGIWGPVLADTITVAAATDNLPGTCGETVHGGRVCDGAGGADCFTDTDCADGICRTNWGTCDDGSFFSCTSDLDCDPGPCVFSCDGGWVGCDTNADCLCQLVTPAIQNSLVLTPPAIPNSLVGTVASFVLVAEANDGVSDDTEVRHCMVNVTAP